MEKYGVRVNEPAQVGGQSGNYAKVSRKFGVRVETMPGTTLRYPGKETFLL